MKKLRIDICLVEDNVKSDQVLDALLPVAIDWFKKWADRLHEDGSLPRDYAPPPPHDVMSVGTVTIAPGEVGTMKGAPLDEAVAFDVENVRFFATSPDGKSIGSGLPTALASLLLTELSVGDDSMVSPNGSPVPLVAMQGAALVLDPVTAKKPLVMTVKNNRAVSVVLSAAAWGEKRPVVTDESGAQF